MPLRNRLEEVINRYEKASTLVKKYKEGAIGDEELGQGFQTLRKDRKAVDEHNRAYLREQRRMHLGEQAAQAMEDDEEEEGVQDGEDDDMDEDGSYEDEDDDEEEEEEEGEEDTLNIAGSGSRDGGEPAVAAARPSMSKKEEKLWRQYGSFWNSS